MIAKYKMIDLVHRLRKNSDRRVTIRTEQGSIGNWTPEINNQEYISLRNDTLVLRAKLDKLKIAYPLAWLEIQPNPVAVDFWGDPIKGVRI